MRKLRRATYNHIEAEIECYRETKQLIDDLELDAAYSVTNRPEIGVRVSGGGYADSVAAQGARLADDRRLQSAKQIVRAIERAWTIADDDRRTLVCVIYKLRVDDFELRADVVERLREYKDCGQTTLKRDDIMYICGLSRLHFYRHKNGFVGDIASFLGWF